MNEKIIRLDKKTILSFLLSFAILYLLITQANPHQMVEIIKSTDLVMYTIALATLFPSLLLRGIRWKKLLENIGFKGNVKDATEILMLSFFVNCIVPAKLGDLYRAYLMNKNYGHSTSKVFGTVFVERSIDLIAMTLLLFIGAFMSFKALPGNIVFYIKVGAGISLLLILALIMFKYQDERIARLIPGRVEKVFISFKDGTSSSITKSSLPIIFASTLAIWILDGGRLFLVMRAMGVDVPYSLAITISLAAALLTAVPVTPAGLGAVEAGMAGILMIIGASKELAVSIAILDRLISYWSILIIGGIIYVFSKKT